MKRLTVIVILLVVALVAYANWRDARRVRHPPLPAAGTPGAPGTSRAELERTVALMRERIAGDPRDTAAAVTLADVLMRQARVARDGALAIEAERVLRTALADEPEDYEALRMLGVVYLSQHRFRQALAIAERTRRMRPRDAWNHGVLGDAHLEVGEYERAFDAYQQMVDLRPDAASYARVSHALELQGDLRRAVDVMTMAAEATSAHDPESQAWHYAQLGNLHVQMGNLLEARRQYQRAHAVFPNHPYALLGFARVHAADGNLAGALEILRRLLQDGPTPEIAAQAGDLSARLGQAADAEQYYVEAERLEREGWQIEEPQPAALARFLAERDRKVGEAVALAEQAARDRHDIFTEDALAWAYFKAGRLQEARAASARALRTGTRDARILYHAAAIHRAAGDTRRARELITRALEWNARFDVLIAPAAVALRERLENDSRRAGP